LVTFILVPAVLVQVVPLLFREQMGTLISGAGTLSTREREVKAKVGAAWFLEPHEEHRFETTGDEPAIIIETFAPARVDYVIQAK
jgi:quercetin dioxygenase-like cupin family protein